MFDPVCVKLLWMFLFFSQWNHLFPSFTQPCNPSFVHVALGFSHIYNMCSVFLSITQQESLLLQVKLLQGRAGQDRVLASSTRPRVCIGSIIRPGLPTTQWLEDRRRRTLRKRERPNRHRSNLWDKRLDEGIDLNTKALYTHGIWKINGNISHNYTIFSHYI